MKQSLNTHLNQSGTQNASLEESDSQSFFLNPEKYKKDAYIVCKKNELDFKIDLSKVDQSLANLFLLL